MNTYANTKKELDRIRDKYGCKGEVIFRTALQYVVEYGQNKFNNDEWVENQLVLIDGKHDEAEAEGKNLWIGREFEKALIECAREIAKVETYSMLVYIQKEVWLSNEGGIDYQRAVELLKSCLGWLVDDCCTHKEIINRLELIDFEEEDFEALGYGYLLNEEEDN